MGKTRSIGVLALLRFMCLLGSILNSLETMEYKTRIYICQVFVLLAFCQRLICPCDDSSTNRSISYFLKGVLSDFLFWGFFVVVIVCLFGWGFFGKKDMVT